MNIALWVVQILLALVFAAAGIMKATQPTERLATNMGWVKDVAPWTVRLIGILEILGAIGRPFGRCPRNRSGSIRRSRHRRFQPAACPCTGSA